MTETPSLRWFDGLPCSVTVCDRQYTVLYMNDRSAEVNAKEGGKALVGHSLIDCHPAEAQAKLRKVMESGTPNVYTIEKNGVRKVIFQAHWREAGKLAGLVEITFELPEGMPHFVRS